MWTYATEIGLINSTAWAKHTHAAIELSVSPVAVEHGLRKISLHRKRPVSYSIEQISAPDIGEPYGFPVVVFVAIKKLFSALAQGL